MSWGEAPQRDHQYAVLSAVCSCSAREHHEELGFAQRRGVHSVGKTKQVGGGLVDLTTSQLDLDGRPPAVVQRDDGIGLKALPIAVVLEPSAQTSGVDAQIAYAQGLEEEAEGLRIQEQSFWGEPQYGRCDGGIGEVARGTRADGGARPQ